MHVALTWFCRFKLWPVVNSSHNGMDLSLFHKHLFSIRLLILKLLMRGT